ncbi:hypothetical protein SCG7109_AJ_00130 [Chlamydiales bacterium SCGC AG-110-M15]|nr:hypothetical protein SCG7109_AJ_00130 [Chlamydiales bacterium SCGC AG-110-M15]
MVIWRSYERFSQLAYCEKDKKVVILVTLNYLRKKTESKMQIKMKAKNFGRYFDMTNMTKTKRVYFEYFRKKVAMTTVMTRRWTWSH